MTAFAAGAAQRSRASSGQIVAALACAAFLLLFLVVPIGRVLLVAFTDAAGQPTLAHFTDFFRSSLYRESFLNSLTVAAGTVVVATLIAAPLAYLAARFRFRGSALIQALGVIPLVMPPFVAAVAMQLLFGRNGGVTLWLDDTFGWAPQPMQGLGGIVFVESLHYFPFILLNLASALSAIDGAMEEAAQTLGASGFRLFRRVVFPLALPGYVAGASLVFIKVFDDLGTPLLLNQTNLLAPQAYLRITNVGLTDPAGYVICVILVLFSILSMWLSARALGDRDYATQQRGGGGLARRPLTAPQRALAWAFTILVLLLTLAPHLGVAMLSFATVWSFSLVPDGWTLAHYARVFRDSSHMLVNTGLYCFIAASIDVVIGTVIAWLALRTRMKGRRALELVASSAIAIPGLVLGIGYLRSFYGVQMPDGTSLASFGLLLAIGYAVRRLPYAMHAASASLRQLHPSLEEAAETLGASRGRTLRRVIVPLASGGIVAGFVLSFVTAAVELSETLVLVSSDRTAPVSYGVYVYMQSANGRGAGAALGVILVVVAALGTWIAHRFTERRRELQMRETGVGA